MKKFLSVLLVFLLLTGMAAVAETTPTAEPTPAETPSATPESTAEAAAEPTALATVEPTIEPTVEPLPLEGIVIGLDPGHQEHANKEQERVSPTSKETKKKVSSGTSGYVTGVAEYVVNLDIALQLRDALEALGATVVMTRTTNEVDISNQERAQMMNEANVDLWLRIHCNGSENHQREGMGLYVAKSNDSAAESYRAAECLLPAMVAATGAEEHGITVNDNYTGNNWSERPCILVEMGYMSNANEDALLNTPSYQQKLVDGMVAGIREFVGR